MTCKFQLILFLNHSQSSLSILLSAPSYLLPESFWNVWSFASSLSNSTTLNFQWVAGLPGNETVDLLVEAGASLPTDAILYPLPPVIAKILYLQYHNWRRHICHSYLNYQVPKVFSEELLLSHPIRCELSCLCCHGHSLLLSSYLHRISRKENSACSACGHPVQDLNHLDCPAFEPLRKSIFGSSLSILDLWSRPWDVAQLLGLNGVPSCPIPQKGLGSTITTRSYICDFTHCVGRVLKFSLEALHAVFDANQISFTSKLYINKPIVFCFDHFFANATFRLA